LDYINKLIFETGAFDFSDDTEKLFNNAMLQCFNYHYNNSEMYKKICDSRNINPDIVKKYIDIPDVFVTVLKTWEFITGSKENVKLTLSSSGTGGQKSFIYLDEKSLVNIQKIVKEIFSSLGMADTRVTNYVCFTYDPEVASDVGTAFSDKMLTSLTGVGEVFYTMQFDKTKNDFVLDIDKTIEKLDKFSKMSNPVRILGFPAHLYFSLLEYKKRYNKTLNLTEGSFVITGGGWKNHAGEEIPKAEFKNILSQMLGISVQNIRDHFGMVEHGIPYVDCEYGNLHIPVYSRAHTFNPYNESIQNYENEGLLMLFSPYVNSYPSISLLTTDKAAIREHCPCGRGPYIDLIGRAGLNKHKGCAIAAIEKLKSGG